MTDEQLIAGAYKSLMTHLSQLTVEFYDRLPEKGKALERLFDAANEHMGVIKNLAQAHGVDLEEVLKEHASEQGFEIPEELFGKGGKP